MKQPLKQVNKDSSSNLFPASPLGRSIRPLKKFRINLNPYDQGKPMSLQKCQAKNPKWVSLIFGGEYDESLFDFQVLKKCKSLQLTTAVFNGLQTGGTVGHFNGKIKYLEKSTRYLKKLDFSAGAVGEQRFIDLQSWIKRLKHLTDLSLVPYWFPVENEDDVEDYDIEFCRTDGVVSLIHFLHAQLRKLTLYGFYSEDITNALDFTILNRLQQFTIRVACRPEGCDGEHDEFGEDHINLIKKAIKSEALKILTLYNQADATPDDFWKSLKKIIIPSIKKPFLIQAKVDYRYSNVNTNKLFKKIFADLPPNIKVTYSVRDTSYFLSLPSEFEVLGESDGNEMYDDEASYEDEHDEEAEVEDND